MYTLFCFTEESPWCLTFSYNMYGSGMGWLQILTKSSGVPSLVWSRYGNQGINWFSAGVTLASSPDLVVSCTNKLSHKNLNALVHMPKCQIIMQYVLFLVRESVEFPYFTIIIMNDSINHITFFYRRPASSDLALSNKTE